VDSRKSDSKDSVFNARDDFVKTVAEKINDIFFDASQGKKKGKKNGNKTEKDVGLRVDGIILAGCGPLRHQVHTSPFLNPRVAKGVIAVLDTAHGGRLGFQEATAQAVPILAQHELKMETQYLDHNVFAALKDDKPVAVGYKEVLRAVEMQAVHTIVLAWEGVRSHAVSNDGKMKQQENKQSQAMANRFVVVLKKDKSEIEHHFCKTRLEADRMSALLQTRELENSSGNGKNGEESKEARTGDLQVKTLTVKRYFEEICEENKINLKVVSVHSPICAQFVQDLSGCVGLLHFAIPQGEELQESD